VIDIAAIKVRFEALALALDEKGRRLFAASEARAAGRGGVVAVSQATGLARSTIDRGLADLRSGAVMSSRRVRRHGGGGKPAIETEPGILAALNELVQSSIRGDPEAPLMWVSKSQPSVGGAGGERLHRGPEAGWPAVASAGLQPAGQCQDTRGCQPP